MENLLHGSSLLNNQSSMSASGKLHLNMSFVEPVANDIYMASMGKPKRILVHEDGQLPRDPPSFP